ncbi:hypothetical protein CKSOR_00068 [Candidatus Kinetoplastibacterium sorsogonicusi]|uniref:Uncharacterized protein n=2 Tax=Candidatus Kinetoplastidibacterium kentomonadis TaxID=1576550 RepID=A0A3S7J955_9PROT|nr:ATP-binding protein [Candidatus Kinetoplastibacterium sorsogonicusi]AWD32212.1 hypothetical protein CKSOR_00068 [Candidatus Kinetoplastibacterium sorsogonicusi]
MNNKINELYQLSEKVLKQLEAWLPPIPEPINWNAKAYKWFKNGQNGYLKPIFNIDKINYNDLLFIDKQKKIIDSNTKNFIENKLSNNVLMTGARGTGKSSLVKAILNKYSDCGLRLIEVNKSDLKDLNQIVDLIRLRQEKFIIFCDDLSFEEGDVDYKSLKSLLDGSVSSNNDNVIIYATSNRRHLLPEYMKDNLHSNNEEIHPGEAVEEKISLSERFGIWLAFYPFTQDSYLAIVEYWLHKLDINYDSIKKSKKYALQWAIERGSRSGRIAYQFAKYWSSVDE